jgi:Ran GTPase-activating protein (RanGAP) involved in mRNA processing and transport
MASPENDEPLLFSVRTESDARQLRRAEAIDLFSGLGDKPYVGASLGGCIIGDDAAVVVAEQLVKLSAFRSLARLSLADCRATLSDAEAVRALSIIITAAADCSEISSLDLSGNALGPMGITACAALFQSRRHCLRNLYFCGAELDRMR